MPLKYEVVIVLCEIEIIKVIECCTIDRVPPEEREAVEQARAGLIQSWRR